jgi:peptidoglycan L-alanyl-D-glutamate endopeptidase CwlK
LVIVGVILYLMVVAFGLTVALLPPVRIRVLLSVNALIRRTICRCDAVLHRGLSQTDRTFGSIQSALLETALVIRRHALGLGLSAAVLLALPMGAALWRGAHAFDGFDHTARHEVNAQVAALLAGEQLVAPQPLPPGLFTTKEVEQAHPLVGSASRQWELLDADFRQRLLVVFKMMREQHGHEMVLIEGYRSPQRQAELAALGPSVTRAAPGQSYHQHGLAADCAFIVNGRIVISERDPVAARGYERLGEVAQAAGLTWGGGWQRLRDLGHVELRRAGVLDQRPDRSSEAAGT